MKNKKNIITISLIALCVISIFGLLLVALTSCNSKSNAKTNDEDIQLNSMELKLNALASDIEVESENCSGYYCANDFVFTKNIDKQKAIEALKPYMIFYDGKPVHTDSNIVVNINGNRADVACTFPNGKVEHVNTGITEIDSPDGVEFAAVTPYEFFRYACVIEKSTCPSGYDVNKTPYYANTSWYRNLEEPVYNLTYNDALEEECEIWSNSIVRTGNGKYHNISANVRILNGLCVAGFTGPINNTDTYQANASSQSQIEQQIPEDEAPDINNPDNPNNEANVEHVDQEPTQSFMETIKEGFNDFKTNVSENETFRTVTICVSSVIGIALIYVLFLIIRKIWRVIKN